MAVLLRFEPREVELVNREGRLMVVSKIAGQTFRTSVQKTSRGKAKWSKEGFSVCISSLKEQLSLEIWEMHTIHADFLLAKATLPGFTTSTTGKESLKSLPLSENRGSCTIMYSTQEVKPMVIHKLDPLTYTSPTWCSHCSEFIWGLTKQGYSCTRCNAYNTCKRCFTSYNPATFGVCGGTPSETGLAREQPAVSPVMDFYLKYVSRDQNGQLQVRNLPEEWKRLFEDANISPSELKDPGVVVYLLQMMEQFLACDVDDRDELVAQFAPPPIASQRRATIGGSQPPPPPPSTKQVPFKGGSSIIVSGVVPQPPPSKPLPPPPSAKVQPIKKTTSLEPPESPPPSPPESQTLKPAQPAQSTSPAPPAPPAPPPAPSLQTLNAQPSKLTNRTSSSTPQISPTSTSTPDKQDLLSQIRTKNFQLKTVEPEKMKKLSDLNNNERNLLVNVLKRAMEERRMHISPEEETPTGDDDWD